MKTREILEIATIVGLVVILVQTIPLEWNDASQTVIKPTDTELKELDQNIPQVVQAQLIEPLNSTKNNSGYLLDYNNRLTEIFEHVENSVVLITSKVSTINSHIIINGNPLEQQSTRLGSGFVYDTSGHIVTNNHVVKDAENVDVSFVNGNTYIAKVIGADPHSDVAVLKIIDEIPSEELIPIPIGDSAILKVGQQAIAIGNPFGLSNTMTTGIISQTGRILPNGELGFSIPNVIQTDAAINPGNSGGPLLNLRGEVIGINTAIQSRVGEFAGIGFAVPSNIIKRIVPVLIEEGSYSHPWLGISGMSLTSELAESLNLPRNYKGAVVGQVAKDGPAEKAGLQESMYNASGELKSADVIIAIDDKEVKGIDDIIIYMFGNKSVDDEVVLTVNRNGQILDLPAVLQERPN